MHEYAIVQSLLDRVADEASRRHATSVQRLHVRIGACSGVDVALLRTAYDTFRERSLCAEAELTITEVPAEWRCPRCDTPIVPGTPLRCVSCDVPASLTQGDEMFLDRIEMEIPNV